ncbi:hypothetical protein KF707_00150 [Candidatus Obscuribacterales bacterium]|nr:hypothetical protein [Candidatus Obscuribacterales bacterium]MBX3134611.1 hypothetical protein [Candidatus Obscuribacterales bacterium]MBX3150004.1 hypothetical protein [Candidatus Obscuribacterales bacterium]
MFYTGVTVNPLSSTLLDIRRASKTSFQSSFSLLAQQEQVAVLSDMEFLAVNLVEKMRQQIKSVDDLRSTTDDEFMRLD